MLAHFFRLLARLCRFVGNFSVSAGNIGFRTTLQIFLLTRKSTQPSTVFLRSFNRHFTFRGAADRGVMSHFYSPLYRIHDTPQRRIQWIVDAGANIGDETIRFRHFHPQAQIIAIEPATSNFAVLQENMRQDPAAICLNNGLWPSPANLKVVPGLSNEAFTVTDVPATGPYDVRAVSINQLIDQYGIDQIDILKLDIEGSEYEVFTRNVENWIHRVNVVIFECADQDRQGMTAAIFSALPSHLFNCSISGESIVMIRRETGWTVTNEQYYTAPAQVVQDQQQFSPAAPVPAPANSRSPKSSVTELARG